MVSVGKNKAANADHYPRAVGPILGKDSTRTTTKTTKSHVDSAAHRGSRVAGKKARYGIIISSTVVCIK